VVTHRPGIVLWTKDMEEVRGMRSGKVIFEVGLAPDAIPNFMFSGKIDLNTGVITLALDYYIYKDGHDCYMISTAIGESPEAAFIEVNVSCRPNFPT
jgi:hypothetical protein